VSKLEVGLKERSAGAAVSAAAAIRSGGATSGCAASWRVMRTRSLSGIRGPGEGFGSPRQREMSRNGYRRRGSAMRPAARTLCGHRERTAQATSRESRRRTVAGRSRRSDPAEWPSSRAPQHLRELASGVAAALGRQSTRPGFLVQPRAGGHVSMRSPRDRATSSATTTRAMGVSPSAGRARRRPRHRGRRAARG